MKKTLRESIYDYEDYQKSLVEMLRLGVALHDGEECPELGVFLGYLRGLQMVHHAHHWQSLGSVAYADHLLFQRLYEALADDIDTLGEKIVGTGGIRMTNYFATLQHMKTFMEGVSQHEELPTESLRAELMLVIAGELIMDSLKERGKLTRGLEQCLGTILDKHETSVYLLQQRTTTA